MLALAALTSLLHCQAVFTRVIPSPAPNKVAFIRTADDLKAAMVGGTEHLIFKSHLDLSSLPIKATAHGRVAFVVPPTVKSISVCTGIGLAIAVRIF
jgi:hypothetical protein